MSVKRVGEQYHFLTEDINVPVKCPCAHFTGPTEYQLIHECRLEWVDIIHTRMKNANDKNERNIVNLCFSFIYIQTLLTISYKYLLLNHHCCVDNL